jgi:hypothetical protein
VKVINKAQPFNVGDVINVRPIGQKTTIALTVNSWRPGIDVHARNWRGQSETVAWTVAVTGLKRATGR